ncbi:unnamed protein product [Protopolystoma xenopodis]|uniref:Innexin n=1 Tax=Protopolystoma xenopodis TaxID=117903 RepID=A0A448WC78_9PLAT|nr:unnamed protein product [Protopolystoma xenopodis]
MQCPRDREATLAHITRLFSCFFNRLPRQHCSSDALADTHLRPTSLAHRPEGRMLQSALEFQEAPVFRSHKGCSLTRLYLLVQTVQILTSATQLLLIWRLFGTPILHSLPWQHQRLQLFTRLRDPDAWPGNFSFIQDTKSIASQSESSWSTSPPRWPHVAWCLFDTRPSGEAAFSKHRRFVQCVLPGNLANEFIFGLISVWHIIQMGIGLARFSSYLWLINSKTRRLSLASNLLQPQMEDPQLQLQGSPSRLAASPWLLEWFTEHYLSRDGILLIRLLWREAGRWASRLICSNLWCEFARELEKWELMVPNFRNRLNGISVQSPPVYACQTNQEAWTSEGLYDEV